MQTYKKQQRLFILAYADILSLRLRMILQKNGPSMHDKRLGYFFKILSANCRLEELLHLHIGWTAISTLASLFIVLPQICCNV